jgi:DNA-binding Lrp family transcriptional regulator
LKAFVLISLKQPREQQVQDALRKSNEVKKSHILFGEWDLIVELEVKDEDHLATFVIQKIRSLKEVKLTSTLIVAR